MVETNEIDSIFDEEVQTLDMTPDKSLMLKMGQKNYTIQQALAELVDNSADEKGDEVLHIDIEVDLANDTIIIKDDARGMDEETFKKSAILGSSTKTDKLGLFGLGLKSSCMNLAENYSVYTTQAGNKEEHVFHFNEENWVNDDALTWTNHPFQCDYTKESKHGTKIVLTKLKIGCQVGNERRLVNRIMDDFSFRYGRLIEDGEIIIKFGKYTVHAQGLSFEEDSKIDFEFYLDDADPTTRISGCVGLNFDKDLNVVKGSQSGKYGFTTYRNKRLITEWDDLKVDKDLLAIRRHPTWGAIIGQIDMDCVPVEADKRGFIQESPLYRQVVAKVREYVKKIEDVIRSRDKKTTISSELDEETTSMLEVAEEAIKDADFKDLVSKYNEEKDDLLDETSAVEEVVVKKKKRKRSDELVDGLKEVRTKLDKDNDPKPAVPIEPSDDPHVREPRKKKEPGMIRKIIDIEDVKGTEVDVGGENEFSFKIHHYYVDGIEGDFLRSWEVLNDEILIIKTNVQPFKTLSGREYPVFALLNVCECYAEYILGDNATAQNVIIIRDDLIRRYYKIMNTFC